MKDILHHVVEHKIRQMVLLLRKKIGHFDNVICNVKEKIFSHLNFFQTLF